MTAPRIIVYSSSDVGKIAAVDENNTFTGTNEFDGTTNFDGATDFDGANTFDGATILNGALSGTSVKDEDNMASDSATAVPTQQSTKAYADTKVAKAGDTMTGDLKIQADNKVVYFGAGDDMSVGYDGSQGNIKTDLVAPSDLHIDCGTDKTMILDETVWDDLRVTPAGFDRAGVADPALVQYTPTGSGIATYLYEFQKDDIAYFTVQLPHTYKAGTDIYAHIHWTPGPNGNEENGATVGWKIDYTWVSINGTFSAMATADLSDACDGTDDKHQMTPDVAIDGHTSSKGISSMLICNVKRTDTGTDDTWAGTASGALPMLLEIDFHYELDTIGSRTISAK